MKKTKHTRLLRVLLPVLGLGLVLAALWAYRYYTRPLPESVEEYYLRLYPNQLYVGPDLDQVTYDYPQLLEAAKAVLVVDLPTISADVMLRVCHDQVPTSTKKAPS